MRAISTGRAGPTRALTTWNPKEHSVNWIHGVIPLPGDYATTLEMAFLTFNGDPATPAGGDPQNWSPIGKNTWDGSQLLFADPLTREQMDKLGFRNSASAPREPAKTSGDGAE